MLIWPSTLLSRRRTLALACAPLLLILTGCPDQTASSQATPGHAAIGSTAPPLRVPTQQSAQDLQQVNDAQHARKVQDVISRAEQSYASGVASYNNNLLNAARMHFDDAVDTMLSSGLDLKNDPALSDEFDRLLSAINSLEMVALKQGNGFSPRVEAAPAADAEEVTFTTDPALLARATAAAKTTSSDLPLPINEFVAGWIQAYTSSPVRQAHLVASLRRAGKYKDMIEKILRDNGVPQDLIYQAITESGFQPQALNRSSGAAGMWQFMPFGNYGLQHNGYFDERFDPEKSTIAYAKYMKTLYGMFGDWYLAMAAYDWGPGNVQRAVSRTGYADYWELYRHNAMPAETKAYIPSVIAAIIIAKNPQQYGLTDLHPDPPILFDTVNTSYAISLPLVADVTGSSVTDIVALNPALLRLTTPRDIPYDLHIPPGTSELYNTRLKDIPESNRVSWRFHIVADGETLDQIATTYHAHAPEIAELNEITDAKPLQTEDEIVIPIAASAAAVGQTRYTTRRSDTLVTVADRFGVTVEDLRSWNHLTSNRVPAGRSLFVAEPVRLAPGTRSGRRGHAAAPATRGRSSHSASRSSGKSSSSHSAAPPKKKKPSR